jgi:hypothetical protein
MNGLNLSGFITKAQPQPQEGDIRQFKDGSYEFVSGHWKKTKEDKKVEAFYHDKKLEKGDAVLVSGYVNHRIGIIQEVLTPKRIAVLMKTTTVGSHTIFTLRENGRWVVEGLDQTSPIESIRGINKAK